MIRQAACGYAHVRIPRIYLSRDIAAEIFVTTTTSSILDCSIRETNFNLILAARESRVAPVASYRSFDPSAPAEMTSALLLDKRIPNVPVSESVARLTLIHGDKMEVIKSDDNR